MQLHSSQGFASMQAPDCNLNTVLFGCIPFLKSWLLCSLVMDVFFPGPI